MLDKFSAKELLTKLQSFKKTKISQLSKLNLQSLKDSSPKLKKISPFVITILISILAHSLLLALPIFSSQNSDDSVEDSEQIAEEDNLEDGEEEENEGIDEDGNLEVSELPPLPSELEDENDDNLDDISDSGADEDIDDIADSGTDESTDDVADTIADDDTDDISTSNSGEDSTDVSDTQIANADVDNEVDTLSEPETEVEEKIEPEENTADTQTSTETVSENETTPRESREAIADNTSVENTSAENTPSEDLFSEAVKYQNVQPLLCGLKVAQQDKRSLQTSDSIDKVSAYFDKKLVEQGYQPQKVDENKTKKVYQISQDGQSRFLHLFSKTEAGTVILISQKRLDCYSLNPETNNTDQNSENTVTQEIQNNSDSPDNQDSPQKEDNTQSIEKKDSPESKPAQTPTTEQVFDNTLISLNKELGWEKAKAEENQENSQTSDIEKVFNADTDKTPDELAFAVKSKLEQQGFQTSLVKDYENGLLYEVKKDGFTKYITFIPTEDQTKVLIENWKKSPVEYQ